MGQMNNRDRFVKLAEARVNKAIKSMRLVGNLSDKSNYSYEEADTKKIIAALSREVSAVKARFSSGSNGATPGFKL
jgi:hypothetical protein